MSFFINLPSVMFLCRAKIILLLYLVALFPSAGYAGKDKKVDSYKTLKLRQCSWKNKEVLTYVDRGAEHYYCYGEDKRFHLKAKEKVRVPNPCGGNDDESSFEYYTVDVQFGGRIRAIALVQPSSSSDPFFVLNKTSKNRSFSIFAIYCTRIKK